MGVLRVDAVRAILQECERIHQPCYRTFDGDNNSNITQIVNGWRDTESDWNSDAEIYNYDGLDRLTSASCTSWSHTSSYDKVGNRTAKDGITYSINTVNEVTTLSDGTTFSYDDNGNRTQKIKGSDTWIYTYDHANRLTKIEKNSTTEGEYVYDGDGRRLQATENSVTTMYIHSGLKTLYEENTTGSACYIFGPTGTIAKKTTINQETHTYYYHTDHLGSTRLVTDENKTLVIAVTYHPFGESDTEKGSEHYLYCGKEKSATGLYYFGARYYDCDLGRFLTRDPLRGKNANPQTLNQYTYCLSNPVAFTDPTGLVTMTNEDGISITETENGWIAKKDGEILKSSDIEDLFQNGQYGDAVILILEFFGCKILSSGGDAIWAIYEDYEIKVEITSNYGSDPYKHFFGLLNPLSIKKDGKGGYIGMELFFNENTDPAVLFHLVGHEMFHVQQIASGDYYELSVLTGEIHKPHKKRFRTRAHMEMNAYQWNMNLLCQLQFPGAGGIFTQLWIAQLRELVPEPAW